jgi:hypothetical protein
MANVIYNSYKKNLVTQNVDVSFNNGSSGFAVALTSGYRSIASETDSWNLISAYEITSQSDYSRKDLTNITVTSASVVNTNTDDYIIVNADDTVFGTSATLAADGAVIYKYLTPATSASSPAAIISFVDFGSIKSSTNGSYTIVWNDSGILNFKQGS